MAFTFFQVKIEYLYVGISFNHPFRLAERPLVLFPRDSSTMQRFFLDIPTEDLVVSGDSHGKVKWFSLARGEAVGEMQVRDRGQIIGRQKASQRSALDFKKIICV
jgi:hypothetical protein